MNNKERLRLELKHKLSVLSESEHHQKSSQLTKNLEQFLSQSFLPDICIGGFVPIQSEPCWFVDKEWSKIAIVHFEKGKELSFHPISQKELGGIGITLPSDYLNEQLLPDVVLVPGLAFTKNGHRLGRGKGCYDRFLSNYQGVAIGLCFEEQIVKNVFNEAHDEQMNFIITEKNIFKGK